ncbi:MAG: hypothetical protein OXE86_03570 [Alphaproteobacteria bacterium]|nr:hypothetical protein [Alphaproteobacteria bacterium]
MANDDLAIRIEARIGLQSVDQKPERASPVSRKQAAAALAADCRLSEEDCATAIGNALIGFGTPKNMRGVDGGTGEPLFAFKHHRCIAGAGRLYSTLGPEGQRHVTFSGQILNPNHEEERLYPVRFCRNCGEEFHPVTLWTDQGREYFPRSGVTAQFLGRCPLAGGTDAGVARSGVLPSAPRDRADAGCRVSS